MNKVRSRNETCVPNWLEQMLRRQERIVLSTRCECGDVRSFYPWLQVVRQILSVHTFNSAVKRGLAPSFLCTFNKKRQHTRTQSKRIGTSNCTFRFQAFDMIVPQPFITASVSYPVTLSWSNDKFPGLCLYLAAAIVAGCYLSTQYKPESKALERWNSSWHGHDCIFGPKYGNVDRSGIFRSHLVASR